MPLLANIYKNAGMIVAEGEVKIPDFSVEKIEDEIIEENEENEVCLVEEKAEFVDEEFENAEVLEETEHVLDEVVNSYTPEYMTKEELAEFYKDEIDEIKSKAQQAAYESAYVEAIQRKRGELADSVQKVDTFLKEIQVLHDEFLTKYSTELKYMAIDVAEKIMLLKIEEDDLVLEKLVMQTVDGVKNTSWLDIELCDRLVSLVDKIRKDMESSNQKGRITVSPVASKIDRVRVNSEKGTIVADVSKQASNLKELFRNSEK